jgi:Tfp pilus assembly protein PilP
MIYICISNILLIVMGCTFSKREDQNKYPHSNKRNSKKKVVEYNEEDVLDMNEARAPEGIKQCPMP